MLLIVEMQCLNTELPPFGVVAALMCFLIGMAVGTYITIFSKD